MSQLRNGPGTFLHCCCNASVTNSIPPRLYPALRPAHPRSRIYRALPPPPRAPPISGVTSSGISTFDLAEILTTIRFRFLFNFLYRLSRHNPICEGIFLARMYPEIGSNYFIKAQVVQISVAFLPKEV